MAYTSDGPRDPVGGKVQTRGRPLAAELWGAKGLDLTDALQAAVDHASGPEKVSSQALRRFVEGVATSTPDGVCCHAIALDDGTLSWNGQMPRGLAAEGAAHAAD